MPKLYLHKLYYIVIDFKGKEYFFNFNFPTMIELKAIIFAMHAFNSRAGTTMCFAGNVNSKACIEMYG